MVTATHRPRAQRATAGAFAMTRSRPLTYTAVLLLTLILGVLLAIGVFHLAAGAALS